MWGMAAVGCLTMFVLGVERLRERRTWLARVRQGKVPGWLVLSPDQVGESTGELPVFCARLFGKRRESMVLAACGVSKRQLSFRVADSAVPRRVNRT